MSNHPACNVCQKELSRCLFDSGSSTSVTSLCRFYEGRTEVFFCDACGHLQTREIESIDRYYADSYDLLLQSDDEDQLYKVEDGKKIFRMDHQVSVLQGKIALADKTRVLDYGCGKGTVLRKLQALHPHLQPHYFEVSASYEPFWHKVVPPSQCAVNALPETWEGQFDLVTSFYALEHIAQPKETLQQVRKLLNPGGLFYFIVPNVFANWADFVVVDHINHFTQGSLRTLLYETGFDAVEIDATSHQSAFIVVARRSENPQKPEVDTAVILSEAQKIVAYWKGVADKVRRFENEAATGKKAAIYGSGFYGTYLATCLNDLSPVQCFLDRDPYKQGKSLLERPIVSPGAMDEDVSVVYVALNPQIAAQNIALVTEWKDKPLEFFYL